MDGQVAAPRGLHSLACTNYTARLAVLAAYPIHQSSAPMLAGQKRPRPDSLADVEPGPAAVDDASDPGHAAMGSVPFGRTESLLR